MEFEWNLSQRFLHMLGGDALKIFLRNLRHWEIGRFEVQSTFETIESAGTSNPKPPRSFRRRGEPSFKDSQVPDGGKVRIAPRAWVKEERGKGAAPVVEVKKIMFHPDAPAVYIWKFYHPEYPSPGLEYPDSPETPGHRMETPAPPDTKQIKHKRNLI